MQGAADALIPQTHSTFGNTPVTAVEVILDEMLRARKRAASQLCIGSFLVLFAFVFGIFVTVHHTYYEVDRNYLNESLVDKGGQNFFPSTISESVHDPESDLGKVFFGCNLVGGMCMLLSQYAWHLRNVFVGDRHRIRGIPFVNLRSLMPPCGLMILTMVSLTPHHSADYTEEWSNTIHTLGTVLLLVVGYAVLEARTLGWFTRCFGEPEAAHRDIVAAGGQDAYGAAQFKRGEVAVRSTLIIITLVFALIFEVAGGLLGQAEDGMLFGSPVCCADVYHYPPHNDNPFKVVQHLPPEYASFGRERKQIYSAANGTVFKLKVTSYAAEQGLAITLILSHITVWLYCKERRFKSRHELLPDTQELRLLETNRAVLS